jgi:hypothetical protein
VHILLARRKIWCGRGGQSQSLGTVFAAPATKTAKSSICGLSRARASTLRARFIGSNRHQLIIATRITKSAIAFQTHLVLALELVLEEAESAELPRELKGGQDGIFAGQGDQGRTGQGTVGVDPGAGVAQGVLLPRGDALVAPAPAARRQTKDQVASRP